MVKEPRIHIIVVAAGSGTRFGGDVPKQFLELEGRKVLEITLARLAEALPEAVMHTVLSGEHLTEGWPGAVEGGATRSASVGNAVAAISGHEDEIVLIHDGARPLVTAALCRRIVEAMLEGYDAAIPALPLSDSIIEVNDGGCRSVDRSAFRAVQTPQAFRLRALKDIYSRMSAEGISFTDDLSALQHYYPGARVAVLDGEACNIKITRRPDIATAAMFLRQGY